MEYRTCRASWERLQGKNYPALGLTCILALRWMFSNHPVPLWGMAWGQVRSVVIRIGWVRWEVLILPVCIREVNERLMVIANHFPGRGSADRPSGEEPATVRKSLEQLKQIELAPYFSVTGNAINAESTADGLLVSHIRYQGFQGNIRSTTRPVSFDPQALSQILSLPAFSILANRRRVDGER